MRRTLATPVEGCYRYRLQMPLATVRDMFLEYVDAVNGLIDEPRWYNGNPNVRSRPIVSNEALELMGTLSCFRGLDDKALADVSSQLIVVRAEANECIHPANMPLSDVYFIVQGSLKVTYTDFQGREKLFRVLSRDEQFGVLAAAITEPLPAAVVARQPSVLLKLDFKKVMELTVEHAQFRLNLLGLLTNGLRQLFFDEKPKPQPSLLVVLHTSPATRPLTQHLIRRLIELGEHICLLSDQEDVNREIGAHVVQLRQTNDNALLAEIRSHITRRPEAKRFIVDVDSALAHRDLIHRADAAIWCIQPEDHKSIVARMCASGAQEGDCREKLGVAWLLPDGCQASPLVHQLHDLVGRDFKVSFSTSRPHLGRLLTDGIERIVHYLRGVQIGVALGGGAAKGMAHLGVLHALEEHRIVIDRLAGTSSGALTGIPYATGRSARNCTAHFAEDLRPPAWFRLLPQHKHLYLLYKYRSGQFDAMLRTYLSDWRLEQLPLPACTVTVDLVGGEVIVRDRGDAVHSILESINLPVLSAPIVREGRALVDGGLVKNVPADVLVKSGCNFIIAVSVTAKIAREFARNRPDTPTAHMKRASILQTVLRSFLVQNVSVNSLAVQPADHIIEPDVTQFDMTDFPRAGELAEVGERTTLSGLPQMIKLLRQLDGPLFAHVKEAAG